MRASSSCRRPRWRGWRGPRAAPPSTSPAPPYTHEGEGCSFDAFLARHRPEDPALALLARIIRGADTERPDLHPASGGLFAAALGFSALIAEDQVLLRHAFPLYDALYLWCRDLQGEAHRWQPAAAA
ncbi:chromate resistance protein ChrB domain-containing protein [Siccirubricoccus sp. G192]|uniref:chromate resistance protein ChrB domain-containing protein n=1 Tax=Siccirubricoccus sp. G192 TaxID=2849651 RepID=UPI001C2BB66F|nr:chromate resistance protein ChrB domain-containing protein [Siccirubricoccus sp. G192]MBV1797655.1 chromate resistance protein [Siccirubricoccus sp. G192]